MLDQTDAARQVEAMLAKGWRWAGADQTKLLHPQDHNLYLIYDRHAGRLTVSPALSEALDLVIPTPTSQNERFWRDEQTKVRAARA